ncbi:glycosyltransferase family 2 protein [Bacillus mycoides]|uniref:glycosyltransferase family 2 protein n=1 Tax=Bacillus mycoides TaxID=1405 RepID=UPI000BFD4257|nr:glycosyltransferase [Bacillus mycoides]MCQ6530779.1 glycosyltransferase [Bacillus mycoides]PGT56939.1 glycosyl transferase family 2 [Bacillus cereus]
MKCDIPLVSIIIPTYNRVHYFRIALESALSQTYSNIEIIVVDDSTNSETYHFIQPYLNSYPCIKYYRNKINIGGALNFIKGYQYCTGEYVNFLMDDDVFHPNKIQIMLEYFLKDINQEVTLVTSYRSLIDEAGNDIPDGIYNQRRFHTVTKLDGLQAGSSIVSEFNWIGEPTTPLFRKKDLTVPFGVFSGRLYRCGVDIAAWLNLLSRGDLIFIPEPLSKLRLHTNNISKDCSMKISAVKDLVHLLFHCRKNNFLMEETVYKKALGNIYELFIVLSQQLPLNLKQKQEFQYYSLLFKNLFAVQKNL